MRATYRVDIRAGETESWQKQTRCKTRAEAERVAQFYRSKGMLAQVVKER